MHARTAVLLLLVVAGLAGGVWWQMQREQAAAIGTDRALVPELDKARVDRIRVDNLERSLQLTLERDAEGAWQIVDPIAFPAEHAVVNQVLDLLCTQRAWAVADPDLEQLSLSPPRVVLELEQETATGRMRNRLEFGAADLDGQHGFVRVDGTVVRTLRSLDSTLERDLMDWRSRALFRELSPYAVTEFHRRGSVALEPGDDPVDVHLDVVNDGGWRATAPWNVQLDPAGIGLLLSSTVFLRTTTFADDAPADLVHYGLDPAPLSISFVTADGRVERVSFAPDPQGSDWFCAVDGVEHIYRVREEAILLLVTPLDVLAARDVVRVVRDRVDTVRFAAAGREVVLERAPRGWLVSGETDAGVRLTREPADERLVEDFLGELERERVLALLPDVPFPDEFGGHAQGVWVEAGEHSVGGSVGPLHTTEDGGVGALWRREGDGLTGLVSARLLELLGTGPEALRSMSVIEVSELEVARIELSSAAGSRTYVRNGQGRWARRGIDVEALAFVPVVDRLLSLRAEQHLQAAELAEPNAPIQVVVKLRASDDVSYSLDLAADGRGLFVSPGGAAEVAPELWVELSELLAGS